MVTEVLNTSKVPCLSLAIPKVSKERETTSLFGYYQRRAGQGASVGAAKKASEFALFSERTAASAAACSDLREG